MFLESFLKQFNKKEVRFITTTLLITVAITGISAYFRLTWRSGFLLAFGMYGILTWFAYRNDDLFLKKLLIFGIAAGIIELLADCWLVQRTSTLIYPTDEPMIACSPLYMPLAWAVILVQIGYLCWLISNEEKMIVTIGISVLIGFAVIPLFEHWAKAAGWWYYVRCSMIGNTPWYIILAEGLICSVLPLFFRHIHHRHYAIQLVLGIIQGLWIWASYFIAYRVVQ
jgi:hypothetical protein